MEVFYLSGLLASIDYNYKAFPPKKPTYNMICKSKQLAALSVAIETNHSYF